LASQVRRTATNDLLLMFLGQAVAMLFPLIATPLLISRLGIDGFGEVMFAFAVATYLGVMVDFGFNVTSMHSLAVAKLQGPEQMAEIVSGTVVARLALATGAAAVVWGLAVLTSFMDPWMVAIAVGSLAGNVLQVGWIFQAMQRIRALALTMGVSRLIALGALISLVRGPEDVELALLLLLSPVLVSAILGWVVLGRSDVRLGRPRTGVGATMAAGFPAFLASLSSALLIGFGTLALGFFRSPADVGVFSGAARIIAAARTAVTPIQTVLFPKMSMAHARGITGWERRALMPLLAPHALLMVVVFVGAEWITKSYLGIEAPGAVLLLRALSVGILLSGIEVWAFSVMVAKDSARKASLAYFCAAAVLVALALPAVLVWGVAGAVVATVSGQMLVALLLVAAIRGVQAATAPKLASR
jgi:O-antigen/teichoic acid export membrane protein